MSSYRKNVFVGATVLIAVIVLGWMILQFGGQLATPFTPKQFEILLVAERADGLSDGSRVDYRGAPVGRVSRVKLQSDGLTVHIFASINLEPALPGNVDAIIRTQGLIGQGAALVLEVPAGGQPQGRLQPGQRLQARFVGLDAIIPPEFGALAKQIRESNVVNNLNEQTTKAGRLIESLDQLVSDPQLRSDLQQTLVNLRNTSDSAQRASKNLETLLATTDGAIKQASGNLNTLTSQVSGRLDQAERLLAEVQGIAAKINAGQGTAGKLVNDPKLYESLTLTGEELTLAIKDLRRLMQQWEQEGVSLKLR